MCLLVYFLKASSGNGRMGDSNLLIRHGQSTVQSSGHFTSDCQSSLSLFFSLGRPENIFL